MFAVETEPVATRVNHEPASILGISSTELIVLLMAAVGIMIAVVIVAILIGFSFFSPVVALVVGTVFVLIGARKLREVKRNRPDRYYLHRMRYAMSRFVPQKDIVLRSGAWSVGRDEPQK